MSALSDTLFCFQTFHTGNGLRGWEDWEGKEVYLKCPCIDLGGVSVTSCCDVFYVPASIQCDSALAWKTSSHFQARKARAVSICFDRLKWDRKVESPSAQHLLRVGEIDPLIWQHTYLVSSTQAVSVRSEGTADTVGQTNQCTPVRWMWKQKEQ